VPLYVIAAMVRRGHYFLCSSNTIPRTGGPSQFYATKESPKNIKYWENYRHGLVLLSRLVFKKEISRAPSASYMKIRSPLYINDKKGTESFLLVENQHTVASALEAILLTVKYGRLCIEDSIGRVLILRSQAFLTISPGLNAYVTK